MKKMRCILLMNVCCGKYKKNASRYVYVLAKSCNICYNGNRKQKRGEEDMKFWTDMHNHTTFSHDGGDEAKKMLKAACEMGMAYFGISEHFDYDYNRDLMDDAERAETLNGDPEEYFHAVRHLQEDYEGVMNVAVGAEFGYSSDASVHEKYMMTYEKFRPDFVINSVHGMDGRDFFRTTFTQTKKEIYGIYLALVRESLDAPYPYDIVGHIGYIARYVPFENRAFTLEEFGEEIDDILNTIIQKGKILEVNSSNKNLENRTLPCREIIQRYYDLGGRMVSFGSDAHFVERIGDKREEVVQMLKEIGFTYITVPFRGEYIKVKI